MTTPIFTALLTASLLFSNVQGNFSLHTLPVTQVQDREVQGHTDKMGMEKIAVDLANEFILPLQDDGTILGLKTKEDYMNYFKNVSELNLAEELLAVFFNERNGVLEPIPTEPPLWFNSKFPYEFQILSDTEMAISQSSSIEIYGPTTLTIFYKKRNGNEWIISEVHYETEIEELNEI